MNIFKKIKYLIYVFLFLSFSLSLFYYIDIISFRHYIFQPIREVGFFINELKPHDGFEHLYTVKSTKSQEIVVSPDGPAGFKIVADLRLPQKVNKAPAILLLHGSSPWGRKAGLIQLLGMRLQEAGFVVLAPDAMNFGDSGHPGKIEFLDTTYDSDFVGRCIEYLISLESVDSGNIYVFGHSLGAGHALDGALEDSRIKSLILVGPPRFTGLDYGETSNWRKARYSADRNLDGLLSRDDYITISKRLDIRNYLDILSSDAHVPLLLMDGEGEGTADQKFLKSLTESISPPFKYLTLADTGHYCGVYNFFGMDLIFYRSDLFGTFFSEIYDFISSDGDELDNVQIGGRSLSVSNENISEIYNKLPRRKQRGINSLQPLRNRAASYGELDPPTIKNISDENNKVYESEINTFIEVDVPDFNFTGNPFDIHNTVVFIHQKSGEMRSTETFFKGNNKWAFRFTGTRTGKWSFTIQSNIPTINSYAGQFNVLPSKKNKGFVTSIGNNWVRSGTGNAFIPQYVMYSYPDKFYNNPTLIDKDIDKFIFGHGFNGFHVPVYCRWFDLESKNYDGIKTLDANPDLKTFEALDLLIQKVYNAGGVVHLWAWGDQQRHQTPIKWGINGKVDKRLQRYLAARLGPLPGWSMGYGFDLPEWVEGPQIDEWYDYLHSFFGWSHMLGARSHKNKLTQLSEKMDYSSYEQHRPDYEKYLETIRQRPYKPSFSEDRFRVREPSPYPMKDYDLDMVRRGLWHSAMAGGIANIWGYLPSGHDSSEGSSSFPNKQQIKTYSKFFTNRFRENLSVETSSPSSFFLSNKQSTQIIVYKEDVSSIILDLSSMSTSQRAIAVDTKKEYSEIDLGILDPIVQKWEAPHQSDWAIAIGEF